MELGSKYKYKITIFTPTYNRGYIINNLYQSIKRQTIKNFEWIIIDDGSTDNTEQLVCGWQKEKNDFPIVYKRVENGGKHRAINRAVQIANGEKFFIVDSDDFLPKNSIETIEKYFNRINEYKGYQMAGICGIKAYMNGDFVGTTFNEETKCCTYLEREKYGISGDKAEIIYTDVMKKYPFPEYKGENFITEAIVWDRMASDEYNLLFFNEIVYLCEYRDDGLTNQGLALFYKNPNGYGLYLRQCREYKKFKNDLQNYFDQECYNHWKSIMSAKQISELIGCKKNIMLFCYFKQRIREQLSKLKQRIIKR